MHQLEMKVPRSSWSPAQMKQQLAMLVAMQEENAKLRAFMAQHLSTSEKLEKLETENNTLRAAQVRGQRPHRGSPLCMSC